MSATQQSKDPVIVVLQLTGGNDYLNTVIPYNNGLYKDNRKAVGIADSDMIQLDQAHAIPKYMAPLKKFWDDDKLAIMHGVGYLDSPRSHFRSMDIWHTCEADKVGTEGWLGRVVREFDPKKENVVTCRELRSDACSARWRCPTFRSPAWPDRWSNTASCRRSATRRSG